MPQKRSYLSPEEHLIAAGRCYVIERAINRLLDTVNGKVPVRVIDLLLKMNHDNGLVECRLEDEMFRRRPHPDPSGLDILGGGVYPSDGAWAESRVAEARKLLAEIIAEPRMGRIAS